MPPTPLALLSRLPSSETCLRTAARGKRYLSASSIQRNKQNKPKQGRAKVEEVRYNFNDALSFDDKPDPERWEQEEELKRIAQALRYKMVTAKDLAKRKDPPRKVQMLVRDFIDDSLYNPSYGYFSKQAQIFTPTPPPSSTDGTPIRSGLDIPSYPNLTAFQEGVAEHYSAQYSRSPSEIVDPDNPSAATPGLSHQVWHTPTSLFTPHYSLSLLRPLLSHYRLHHYPYSDFVIYELGAGNAQFCLDVCRYLREEEPEVWRRTRYTIVEISKGLAGEQRRRLEAEGFTEEGAGDGGRVKVVNRDFMEWESGVGRGEECYVVALEVLDNLAHDLIRYDLLTLQPLQATLSVSANGDFSHHFTPITDPLITSYLSLRRLLTPRHPSPSLLRALAPPISPLLLASPLLRKIYAALPFAPNLSPPEWIPTKQLAMLKHLREQLPLHKLLVSDFDRLGETVEGRDGPVVQTRYGGTMVPMEGWMVGWGWFDIFFPTNFELLREMYTAIMTLPSTSLPSTFFSPSSTPPTNPKHKHRSRPGHSLSDPRTDLLGVRGFNANHIGVSTHREFLERWAGERELQGTTTGGGRGRGENVMLGMYENVKVMF